MTRHWKWVLIVPGALVGFAAFVALGGWVVMRLWNWLLPALFGWPVITVWQGLGLLALCRILFGGFGKGGGSSAGEYLSWKERKRMRRKMREREEAAGEAPATE